MSSTPKIVFGTMTFGDEGKEMARLYTPSACKALLDIAAAHQITELDTARVYGQGTSETMLARIGVQNESGWMVSTKVAPNKRRGEQWGAYTLSTQDIQRSLDDSLAALQTDKIDIFYLHMPDREVPLTETLQAIDEQHKAGKFERFGISNYSPAEVEEILRLTKEKSWIAPSVYQGMYSAVTRGNEPLLLPLLKKHNIAFYAYSPLGGGFFAGAIGDKDAKVEPGSRFDPNKKQGAMYRDRYLKDSYFTALDSLKKVADAEGLTLGEIALRWIAHHSALSGTAGDAVLLGASSAKQLETNLLDIEKGPLPQTVQDELERAWKTVQADAPPFHR